MISLFLAFGLFCFFVLVGIATLSLLRYQESVLRTWLLSPAVGLAVVVLLVLILSQAGLPVRLFAGWLGAGLFVLSVLILWLSRTILPTRQLLPFICVVLLSLVYTGWPAIIYGFNWISYGNPDMVYYTQSAARVLDNGFYQVPSLAQLSGKDHSQWSWFAHVLLGHRPGSELILAFVSGAASISPVQSFMPTIVAFSLVQIWSCAGLVLNNRKWRRMTFVACCFLFLSPVFSLGTYYQLIAQVSGIGLLLTCCAITMRPVECRTLGCWVRNSLLVTILVSALLIVYPEVFLFLVLAAGLYWLVQSIAHRRVNGSAIALVGFGVIGSVVILRQNFMSMMNFLLISLVGGLGRSGIADSLFPYYLVPSGLANLFGFQAIAKWPAEPLLSITILISAVLLLLTIAVNLYAIRSSQPFAFLFLFMLVLALKLFFSNTGFGLYKLAMYIQPVLMINMALVTLYVFKKKWIIGLSIFVLSTFSSQVRYASSSLGMVGGGFSEVPLGSKLGINDLRLPKEDLAIMDSYNFVSARLATLDLKNTMMIWPTGRSAGAVGIGNSPRPNILPGILPNLDEMQRRGTALADSLSHLMGDESLWGSSFAVEGCSEDTSNMRVVVVSGPSELNIFNRSHDIGPGRSYGYFRVVDKSRLENWILFIMSSRGQGYYGQMNRRLVSIYQPEMDYFQKGKIFAGIGRFMLLRIENPTEKLRLRVNVTRTLMGPGRTILPEAAKVMGESEQVLGFVGCGSANIVSPLIQPIKNGNSYYIALDMGMDGLKFPSRQRKGLMNLYGKEVSLDIRYLVCFARDISAISEEEYREIERPKQLKEFPSDLISGSGLEYSGIYEDGWVSNDSFLKLGKSSRGDTLFLRLSVPHLGVLATAGVDLIVQLGTQEPFRTRVRAGESEYRIPITQNSDITIIKLGFSQVERLPSPDDRPVAARIVALSIMPGGR